MDNLNIINESIRQQLYALESIKDKSQKLNPGNRTESKVKDKLIEYLSTAMADLLIISDFIYEVEDCTDDIELNYLLDGGEVLTETCH